MRSWIDDTPTRTRRPHVVVGAFLFLYKGVMGKVLDKKFFERSAVEVAPELLGKFLVRRIGGKETSSMITEVEAYCGTSDRASHAFRGITKRTEVMFSNPGRWYVYLVYGMHLMLNIVTNTKGCPDAVLIRGVLDISGPARVAKYFAVNKNFNKLASSRKSNLWIEDRGVEIKKRQIQKLARIGVDYAGPYWSKRRWRFLLKLK